MRLLVTRPRPDADLTAERLRELGHEVYVQSLSRVEFLPLAHSPDPTAIVVTSRNAIRALQAWPRSVSWRDRPLFAVGDATAAVAEAVGFKEVRSANGDGSALASLVIHALDPARGPILYPAAKEHSPRLEIALRADGFEVCTVTAYRMLAAKDFAPEIVAVLKTGLLEGVLLYSKRSASIFLSLIDRGGLVEALRDVRMFLMSETVADLFKGRMIRQIDIAAAPQEEALISLIPSGR